MGQELPRSKASVTTHTDMRILAIATYNTLKVTLWLQKKKNHESGYDRIFFFPLLHSTKHSLINVLFTLILLTPLTLSTHS